MINIQGMAHEFIAAFTIYKDFSFLYFISFHSISLRKIKILKRYFDAIGGLFKFDLNCVVYSDHDVLILPSQQL